MKIGVNNLRPDHIINHQGRSWRIIKLQHVKPGKGGAFIQVELKDLISGSKLNERFRSEDTVERMHLKTIPCQYLYMEQDNYIFMNNETFEQYILQKNLIEEETIKFLRNNIIVHINFLNEKPINIKLPEKIIVYIESADAAIKGQTASSSYKPAILSNGLRIMVPPHINAGEKIVISTTDFSYIERAKTIEQKK